MDSNHHIKWFDVREFGVEGRGWSDTDRFFDRLPRYAQQRVPPEVWDLSRHSTGMCTHFETNSCAISARWTLRSESLALPHMPATAVSGLDLYRRDTDGEWRWLSAGHPETFPSTTVTLVHGLEGTMHAYKLYLPLFNGVEALEVGVEPDARFIASVPRVQSPIVFYGTSILQGIAASRPGACHSAILGRKLNRHVINLGFAGKGKMDLALAELLTELSASVYVVDCLPNMAPELVEQRAGPFLERLLEGSQPTPIVVVEDRTYANAWAIPALQARNDASRKHLRNAYDALKDKFIDRFRYVAGDQLLGEDDEATVDGSHPTDLGFIRYAEHLYPVLADLMRFRL